MEDRLLPIPLSPWHRGILAGAVLKKSRMLKPAPTHLWGWVLWPMPLCAGSMPWILSPHVGGCSSSLPHLHVLPMDVGRSSSWVTESHLAWERLRSQGPPR